KGDDDELFSDGRTDSDRSEPYKVLLCLERENSCSSSAVAGEKEGVRPEDLLGQPVLEVMEEESVSVKSNEAGQVDGDGSCEVVGEQGEV
ncbi:hypothetical protein A2U01_0081819, partial [Trifolium medium]|nr:hypothetical protein [Trifolium medium]